MRPPPPVATGIFFNSKQLPFSEGPLCASHVVSCKCSHMFFTATVLGVSPSHLWTYKKPEARVREQPRCRELTGGRVRGDGWGWHPKCSVSSMLESPPAEGAEPFESHGGLEGRWGRREFGFDLFWFMIPYVSLILRWMLLVRVYYLWILKFTLPFPPHFMQYFLNVKVG